MHASGMMISAVTQRTVNRRYEVVEARLVVEIIVKASSTEGPSAEPREGAVATY